MAGYLNSALSRIGPEAAAAAAALAGLLLWRIGDRSPLLALLRWWLFALGGIAFGAAQSWLLLARTRPTYLAEQRDWVPLAGSLAITACLLWLCWRLRPDPAPLQAAIASIRADAAVRRLGIGVPVAALAAGAGILLGAEAVRVPPPPTIGTGALWAGTAGGLSRLDRAGWLGSAQFPGGRAGRAVSAITLDQQERVWIGTGHGLAMHDGRGWTWFGRHNSALPGGNVLALAVDHDGVVWAAGEFGVAAFAPEGRSQGFKMANSPLLHNVVDAIYVDSQNRKWFGSAGGVNINAGGSWVRGFNSWNSGLPADLVFTITQDGQGRTWFGTVDGAARLDADEATWTRFWTTNSGLPHDKVHAIAVDPLGRVWLGTEGGAAVLDGDRWTTYRAEGGGLPHPWVQALAVDGQGRIWAGTRGGGLSLFDGQKWRTVRASRLHSLTGWLVPSHWQRSLIHDDVLALAWTK